MPTYIYPTVQEMFEIDAVLLARLIQDDPIFQLFPIRRTNGHMVSWRQRDTYRGLQQIRGFNGDPLSVPRVGANEYIKMPSAFGEFTSVSELELTSRAGSVGSNVAIPVNDLVGECDEMLLTRQLNRMSWILWQLLVNGYYIVTDEKGSIVDRDAYTPLRYTAPVLWSSPATAAPLADGRAVQLLADGTSTSFDSTATEYMNQNTFNLLNSNTNAADLGGRRGEGLTTLQGLDEINKVLLRDNLPQIAVWNMGYISDGRDGNTAGTFQKWIPTGKSVVVGKRSNNAAIGEFLLTRNVNNPDNGSQPYFKIVDRGAKENEPPPRRIDVHRGWNGGPGMYFPGSVVVKTVA